MKSPHYSRRAYGSSWQLALLCCLALTACGARTELWLSSTADGGASVSAGGALSSAGFGGAMGGMGSGAGVGGGSAGLGGMAGAAASLKLSCPSGPADPRLPLFKLGVPTALDGTRFVSGDVQSWRWELLRDDCDAVVANPEFVLQGAESPQLTFQAIRPSVHRFRLRVAGRAGDSGSCDFEVPTDGRGLRVELCWNTSQDADLDLYLHNPFDEGPWFTPGVSLLADGINATSCNVANCTASLRLGLARANFAYPDSPASFCQAGPAAAEFQALGRCPNPRAGEDNNQSLATGIAERVQLDAPVVGSQTFRVMVQNFSNSPAEPHVFVYCGGKKAGEAAPPALPVDFRAFTPGVFGVMWRALDITSHVSSAGAATQCEVSVPAAPDGHVPYVTTNDPSF